MPAACWRPAFFAALLEALPEVLPMQLPEPAELLAELQPQVGTQKPWHCVTAAPAAHAQHLPVHRCLQQLPQLAVTPGCLPCRCLEQSQLGPGREEPACR